MSDLDLKLPEVVSVNTQTVTLKVGGRTVKVKKRQTQRTWDPVRRKMTSRRVWDSQDLGLKGLDRLEMEWRLLLAAGNKLEQWEHQRSLPNWHLAVLPSSR